MTHFFIAKGRGRGVKTQMRSTRLIAPGVVEQCTELENPVPHSALFLPLHLLAEEVV